MGIMWNINLNQSINLQIILEPMKVGRHQFRFSIYRKNLCCVVEIVKTRSAPSAKVSIE